MNRQQLRTLEALYAHPLRHGVRRSQVEALFRALGAEVSRLDDQRLRIRMPAGPETWIHRSCGRQPDLDSDAMLRARQFLQELGVTPDHPEAAAAESPRGDQSRRLVLVLDHHHTEVFRLEGDRVEHAVLHPHGVWGSGENLTHRHDRDIAGQRAPRDADYLARIREALGDADVVLLLGHGKGESDLRQVLLDDLSRHRRDLLAKVVGVVTLEDGGLSEEGLLALAREHFGNLPHRRPLRIPGQELLSG
ncbi:MAG: hypothetical protein VKK97_12435 [Synechococcaceae cyanobacterium]|jgi:hypothetical protein|nr:hypothetical protein [Synechococcaceae cyanobacterium]